MQAIYARQSVDKRDSISIESQIEKCMEKLNPNEDYEVYQDKGFSGGNVERPEFQRMMSEVKKGNISRIVIYKLDRISRSLIDFLTMQKEFEKYNVELKSYSESFETSGIMGKTIVNILMVFAQMERETIQLRITDNYYSRGEKGYYLGGYAPFGYTKVETTLYGKKTYMFEVNKKESPIIKKMYEDYSKGKSLSSIARWLNDNKIETRKNNRWSSTCVARMLRNPIYVKANADVYNYLLSLGATINNPVEDFIGENGCYVYGNLEQRQGSKFVNMKNDFVTIGLHKGIIEPSLWLDVQYVFNNRKGHSNLGTGSLTWLQGLVKCGCGYTYYVKKYKTKVREHKYLYCRGRKNNTCPYPHTMMRVDTLEEIVENELFERVKTLQGIKNNKIIKDTPEINALKIRITSIDEKIGNLMGKIAEGESVATDYIYKYIEKYDKEKTELLNEITSIELKNNRTTQISLNADDFLKNWYNYDLETKKQMAKEVIEKIIIEDKEVSIIFF